MTGFATMTTKIDENKSNGEFPLLNYTSETTRNRMKRWDSIGRMEIGDLCFKICIFVIWGLFATT